MIRRLLGLTCLTDGQIKSFGSVLMVATLHNEGGVIEWASRAVNDAVRLGRLRDRDVATLERLERLFNGSEYYNQPAVGNCTA